MKQSEWEDYGKLAKMDWKKLTEKLEDLNRFADQLRSAGFEINFRTTPRFEDSASIVNISASREICLIGTKCFNYKGLQLEKDEFYFKVEQE